MHVERILHRGLGALLFVLALLLTSSGTAWAQDEGEGEERSARLECNIIVNIIDKDPTITIDNIDSPSVVQYTSQEFNISPTVIRACIQRLEDREDEGRGDGDGDGNTTNNDGGGGTTGNGPSSTNGDGTLGEGGGTTAANDQYKADVIVATIPKKPLPVTGGMPLSLFAVIGLAAIVAGAFILWAVMSRRA